jgi:hypothetical protein
MLLETYRGKEYSEVQLNHLIMELLVFDSAGPTSMQGVVFFFSFLFSFFTW